MYSIVLWSELFPLSEKTSCCRSSSDEAACAILVFFGVLHLFQVAGGSPNANRKIPFDKVNQHFCFENFETRLVLYFHPLAYGNILFSELFKLDLEFFKSDLMNLFQRLDS